MLYINIVKDRLFKILEKENFEYDHCIEATKTGDVSGLPFKLHDFGARGSTTMESVAFGERK